MGYIISLWLRLSPPHQAHTNSSRSFELSHWETQEQLFQNNTTSTIMEDSTVTNNHLSLGGTLLSILAALHSYSLFVCFKVRIWGSKVKMKQHHVEKYCSCFSFREEFVNYYDSITASWVNFAAASAAFGQITWFSSADESLPTCICSNTVFMFQLSSVLNAFIQARLMHQSVWGKHRHGTFVSL